MNKSQRRQSGAALLELVIVLPVLIILTGVLITLGSLLQQLFWFEQTTYNSALHSAMLPIATSTAERQSDIQRFAAVLGKLHRKEQKYHLIEFDPDSNIEADPIDVSAASADKSNPQKRFNSVTLQGNVDDLFVFSIPIKSTLSAMTLFPLPSPNTSARFCGSNPSDANCYNYPGCCGNYPGGPATSCVSSGAYANCPIDSLGYVAPSP